MIDNEDHKESVVGRLFRMTHDMSAACEDLANNETIVLDSEFSRDSMFWFINTWRMEILALHNEMMEAKARDRVIAVVYGAVKPVTE